MRGVRSGFWRPAGDVAMIAHGALAQTSLETRHAAVGACGGGGGALGGCSADIATFSEQRDMAARWEAPDIAPANYKADLIAYMRIYSTIPSTCAAPRSRRRNFEPSARGGVRDLRAIRRARQRRQIHGRQGRRRGLCVSASSTSSSTGRRRRANLQGRRLRAVPGAGKAHPLIRRRGNAQRGAWRCASAAEPSGPAAAMSDKRPKVKPVRRGHLTLRFSAEVFPRFSTSSN